MHHDATAPPPPPPLPAVQPVAPSVHTLALFALLAVTTWFGHGRVQDAAAHHVPPIPHYGVSIALEWILLALVVLGIGRRRDFFRTALFSHARTMTETLGYGLMVYLLGFMAVVITGMLLYFTPLGHQRNEAAVLALLPHTTLQFLLWFCVSLTAGVCEELIFRGYLQQQLAAWTQRPVLAIVLGALLFGSVHLYEGLGAILPLAALGLVYGLVVRHFKGDLRAVIIAHTLQDFLVALLALARPALEHLQTRH